MSNTRHDQELSQMAADPVNKSSAIPVVAPVKPARQNSEFFNYYMKAVFTGMMVGPVSSTLTFPVDKVAFAYQTMSGHTSPSFYQALCLAFKHPFSGYFPGILNSASKNIFMFPAKAFFQRHLDHFNPNSSFNNKLAGFFAGILTVYITSPISVIKALRYKNMPLTQIRQLNWNDLFRGVHATALRDGVHFGAFFGIPPLVSLYTINPVFAGSVAGLVGGFFSNPLSVVAMNQKVKGTRLAEEAASLYREGGVKRFYPGFFRTTALRMGIQGAATGTVIYAAEKVYDHLLTAPDKENSIRQAYKKL